MLASIGLDHSNDEVFLEYHRDRFRAITEIAAHPKLSKHMPSLSYMADRNKLVDFEEWNAKRPFPESTEADLLNYESLAAYTARDPRAVTEEEQARRWQEARPPENGCQASREVCKALCHDQTVIEQQAYDEDCLRALFEGCPKLREITVASHRKCIRQLDANRMFASAMTRPEGDQYWWTENVRQTLSVAIAADRSGRKFDSLTLAANFSAIFDKHVSVGETSGVL